MAGSSLTLQDIADLAHVQRPVVSMWRKRQRTADAVIPFPEATLVRDRVEHFDAAEVVAWLKRTGRGNNPDVDADAPTVAVPVDADVNRLEVLLCLAALSGEDLAGFGPGALVDLADDVDPEDEFLFREIQAVAPTATALTAYVDELLAGSFSGADALEHIERGRLAREGRRPQFHPAARRLVAVVTQALAVELSDEAIRLVDASAGRSRLALETACAWPEGTCLALVVEGDAPEGRRQRRAARVSGLDVETRSAGPAVAVLSVMGLPAAHAIRAIDDVQLSLPDDQVAVVIGPASMLCDEAPEDVEADRAAIIRTGKLRAAVRLPRGWWPVAPRQALGLWVFGTTTAPRLEDRAVAIADIGQAGADDTTFAELTTDVVAAMGDLRARSFSIARVLQTARVVASRVIVPPGARPRQPSPPTAAERALRIEALVDAASAPVTVERFRLRPAERATAVRAMTIDELARTGLLQVKRGARLDLAQATTTGAVRLCTPTGYEGVGFDPLDLETHHSRAVRTEPRDVVFTCTPAPAAFVDEPGGSVFAYPARVLRLRERAPVGPHVLAWIVNQQPSTAREWKAWWVPLPPPEESDRLEKVVRGLTRTDADLEDRRRAVNELARELIEGVAAGAMTLVPEDDEEGR